MTEWWTYRLSDFLLFSPRTYYRLSELYNAEVWPAHLAAIGIGIALLWCVTAGQARPWAARAACALLAPCWLWIAWAFHLQRYTTINWAATWFAAAFAVQGVLLSIVAAAPGAHLHVRAALDGRRRIGLMLLLFALFVQPWLGVVLGRPWQQAELFGLAPDPTVLATLALPLLLQRGQRPTAAITEKPDWPWLMLWPVTLLWCFVSGATLWAMQAPEALLMPAGALLTLIAAGKGARQG